MTDAANRIFIAGDWGTSHLRLLLCRREVGDLITVLDRMNGPGVAACKGKLPEKLFELIDPWVLEYGKLSIVLSGMVGSNIGWLEAPYLECPVDIREIVHNRVQFMARGHNVSIIPGLAAQSPLGHPDIMRGEEMQILGWLMQEPDNRTGTQLLCLPGTHTKWVLMEDGRVKTFQTIMTGELFGLLKEHSVLVMKEQHVPINEEIFLRGVRKIQKVGGNNLSSALFGVRSEQIRGGLAEKDAAAYLSGHLIGADILSALTIFKKQMSSVILIGETGISKLFALTLKQMDIPAIMTHATEVFLNGINYVDQLGAEENE